MVYLCTQIETKSAELNGDIVIDATSMMTVYDQCFPLLFGEIDVKTVRRTAMKWTTLATKFRTYQKKQRQLQKELELNAAADADAAAAAAAGVGVGVGVGVGGVVTNQTIGAINTSPVNGTLTSNTTTDEIMGDSQQQQQLQQQQQIQQQQQQQQQQLTNSV